MRGEDNRVGNCDELSADACFFDDAKENLGVGTNCRCDELIRGVCCL